MIEKKKERDDYMPTLNKIFQKRFFFIIKIFEKENVLLSYFINKKVTYFKINKEKKMYQVFIILSQHFSTDTHFTLRL